MKWTRIICTLAMSVAALTGRNAVADDSAGGKDVFGFEFPVRTYEQQFVIHFRNEQAAANAQIVITPLYNGYTWSISSRWDDNNAHDMDMRDTLTKHGHKGTFYLNARKVTKPAVFDQHNASWDFDFKTDFYLDPKYDYGKSLKDGYYDFASTARKLLEGGHSIGGHSLMHPRLSYLNRNRIFEEVAGIRVMWEAAADTLLNSHAFSYCDYYNRMEKQTIQKDITRALERAGFYNIVNQRYEQTLKTDLILSPIMPNDGRDIDDFAQKALKDKSFQKKYANLSYAMHVWYRTPQMWAKFEKDLDKYGHNPDWWYCNQNDYAAYRYQLLHSTISTQRDGAVLKIHLQRPELLAVNYPTPLTFAVKGVKREDVVSVSCETADCVPSERQSGEYLFNLYQDRSRKLPEKIGLVNNEQNRLQLKDSDQDSDFANLRALLCMSNAKLRLTVDNQTGKTLDNVRITYRLPLRWKEGIERRQAGTIEAGRKIIDELKPTVVTDDYRYTAGSAYYAAQVDFVTGGKAGRLYATCKVKNNAEDKSFPQGGFLRLGPVLNERIDMDRIVSDIQAGKLSTEPWQYSWQMPDGILYDWVRDPKDSPHARPYLSGEVIRTFGRWMCETPMIYLLQSSVKSEIAQPVKFTCQKNAERIFLNGKLVKDKAGQLVKGDNNLVIVYNSNRGAYGCFLRLVNPATDESLGDKRLRNITFAPADCETNRTGVFRPYVPGSD